MAIEQISTGLFLQRLDDPLLWEEVDQYTWDQWDKAVLPNGMRYSGNRVKKAGLHIDITAAHLTARDLAIICRFCGVRDSDAPGSVAKGFVRTPEFVRFSIRKRLIVHEIGGCDYAPRTQKAENPGTESNGPR